MATILSRIPVEHVDRADALAYVMTLGTLSWASDATASLAAGDVTGYAVSVMLLGVATLGAAVYVHRNPDAVANGSDPAPRYLLALAAVATLAFTVVALNAVQSVA